MRALRSLTLGAALLASAVAAWGQVTPVYPYNGPGAPPPGTAPFGIAFPTYNQPWGPAGWTAIYPNGTCSSTVLATQQCQPAANTMAPWANYQGTVAGDGNGLGMPCHTQTALNASAALQAVPC